MKGEEAGGGNPARGGKSNGVHMVQKSFKELFDEAKRRHGYWLAKMELEFMEKVWGSVSLKPHRKQIGRMIEETFQKVSDECKE